MSAILFPKVIRPERRRRKWRRERKEREDGGGPGGGAGGGRPSVHLSAEVWTGEHTAGVLGTHAEGLATDV